jgi:two-component system sensor histidine kinase RpfC
VQRIDKRLSNAAILDQETLSDLELLGSGISFVAELVANFLQDSEHLLKRMVTAQQQAQTHIFRDIAHALKGSAGSVGAKELFKLASEACTLRGKQFEHTSAQLVEDLDSAFQTARVALLAHIDERKSQNSQ